MRTVLVHIVFLLLCSVTLPAQTRNLQKINISPFVENPTDTFCMKYSGCFVRTPPKKQQPLRLSFCETGFCLMDKNGVYDTFEMTGIYVSFRSGTAYTSYFVPNGQYTSIGKYLNQVGVGSSVTIEAARYVAGSGMTVWKGCNALEYKRIK